jgi:hypothetical protein
MKARALPEGGDNPAGTALRLFAAYANWKIGQNRTNDGEVRRVLLGIKRAEEDSALIAL